MKHVEFFFDLSSPWTYLAFHNIRPILARTGASIVWRPFLVGGVFNAVNPSIYALRENPSNPKLGFMSKSLQDWAAWSSLPLIFPSQWHPLASVHAMRVCTALQDDQRALQEFATAAFAAYFRDARNIDAPEVLTELAGAEAVAASRTDAVKARLRGDTQEVIDRGGFGSPTIFVDSGDMYFGNDQLPLVERALREK